MFSARNFALTSSLLFTIILSACTAKEVSAPTAPVWKPSGNEGSITGSASFAGAVPSPRKIDMSLDSTCVKLGEAFAEDLVVKDGKLANVFVYVKKGLPKEKFETPATEVVLDQRGCKYVPRVLGIQTGQSFKVLNSDQTDHNIHPVPKSNNEWNQSQMAGQGPLIRKFTKEEVMIEIKCNKHPWMVAWVGVLSHPYFDVSKADGSFGIKGLPPGEYELEAWHEKLGTKIIKLTVKEKSDVKVDVKF